HPHKETIEALQKTGIEIFRVDKDGTILASSDGQRLEFSKNKGTGSSNAAPPGVVQQPSPSVPSNSSSLYIGNKNSKKFHLSTCQSLPAKKNRIEFSSRAEALAQGYVPCQSCNP
ncbi:MAG: Ada metal-binding domain-containing protein, partial [Syntrophomonas sp.]